MTTDRIEETPAEIRRVALEMFVSRGYDGSSIRDIASEVGIRGASMYHHFSSKEEILWDLTRLALDDLAASWHSARDATGADEPEVRLRAFVRSGVEYHARHRTEAMLVNSQLHRLSPEHFSIAAQRRRSYEEELTAIVGDCVATGQYSVPDVRLTVYAILQMTSAIATWFKPEGRLSVAQVAGIYETLALRIITAT